MSTKTISVIKRIEIFLPKKLNKLYKNVISILKKRKYKVKEVNLPKKLRENLQITYLILCSSELVSHLNSLQGITFGNNEEIDIVEKRSKNLGKIVKQRLLIGAYFLERPHLIEKAQKLRFLIDKWTQKLFQKANFLIFPSTNHSAPSYDHFNNENFSGLISSHWSDNLLLIANFSGLPSCSLPIGLSEENLPFSINLNGAYKKDREVLKLAEILEEKINF